MCVHGVGGLHNSRVLRIAYLSAPHICVSTFPILLGNYAICLIMCYHIEFYLKTLSSPALVS